MSRIILASASPQRKVLLDKLGIQFDILPSEYEEDNMLPIPPDELVKRLALGKAEWVAKREPDALIIVAGKYTQAGFATA